MPVVTQLFAHNARIEIALGKIPHTKLWHQRILYVCFCSCFPVSAYVIHIKSRQAIGTFAYLSLLYSNLHNKTIWLICSGSFLAFQISITTSYSVIGIELVHFYLKALTETGMN